MTLEPNAEPDPASLVLEFRRMLDPFMPVPRFEGEKLPCAKALDEVGRVLAVDALDTFCDLGT